MSTPASTKISVFAVAILSALVVGCTNHQRAPKGFSEATVQPYRLDSGDRLRINVFEQASLSGSYTVDQAGYVAFPLIGAVPSRGHTLPELEGMIAAKLRQGFLKDPDVTIEVDRYRTVFIMGEVGQAGQYAYVPGMTVQNAIAVAGGFTPRANQASADITRKINGRVMTGRVPITDPVLAGDTVYVRERLF
ncbi:polysaccharide export protein [Sinorhizobium medicae]|nr:polysaccharide export protein [Sinorhizobium medicae]MDX0875277.1 polysaccharide export protein [Sinorhizobium medicae]